MARVVKEYDVRRTEILDVAQQLFYTKGYEQTSIQDLLTAVGIAKGTFYHYFDSKQALLAGLTERMVEQVMILIEPIVSDSHLNACQKLEQLFAQAGHWKFEHKGVLLQVLGVYYQEENLRLRHSMLQLGATQIVPIWAQIIEQGIAEGMFAKVIALETAEIIFRVMQGLSETIAMIILHPPDNADAIIERKVVAYQGAIERILGAPPGTLPLIDLALTKRWLE